MCRGNLYYFVALYYFKKAAKLLPEHKLWNKIMIALMWTVIALLSSSGIFAIYKLAETNVSNITICTSDVDVVI